MAEINVTREDASNGGRYVAHVDGGDAELAYTKEGSGVVSADHTFVPNEARGQGVAEALLDKLLSDARSEGFRIVPRCQFVARQYAHHPEWADLFTTRPGQAAD
ncbi:MAG: GNAT family N-acetyltransferase [Paracoccus denitrificans]|nr:MAG: GNAT family N-acetyltransferase [Paracoccus denitrificans]PZO85033.1 MAG: GNAT family N-acetyltransferase [Paracoccus denitrificans]